MRLAGIEVSELSCRELVDLLLRVGRDDDLALAQRIDRNLARETRIMGLSPDERTTLLGVLDDPPPEWLAELRGALFRDHRDRQEP
jgi:hypothetical protein